MLPADSELAQAIAVPARAQQDAVWRRTKASNELRSLLREFYPTFLATFTAKSVANLAKPETRAILAIAPTPAHAANMTKIRVAAAPRRADARPALPLPASRPVLRPAQKHSANPSLSHPNPLRLDSLAKSERLLLVPPARRQGTDPRERRWYR